MSGLSPEARDLFARARDADAVAPADRERNRVALQAALGVLLPASGAVAQGWVAAALPRALAALALATATAVAVAPAPVSSPAAPPAVARPIARSHHAAPRTTLSAPAPTVTPAPAPSLAPPAVTPPARAPVATRRRTVVPPEERVETPAPAVDAAFTEQLRLLGEAQAALRVGDTQRALAAAAECRRRHPHGALASEAEAVSLLASCASGRAVRDEVARWLAASPRSPLAGRVRRACGVDAP